MKIVLFDGMNLVHRSRNSFSKGDHALTYSFFRSFKPLLEKLEPDVAYFVLEGKQKHRSDLYDGYKSNRSSQPSSFWRQQGEILEIMKSLPIIQVRHPDHECDDVIANLAKYHANLKRDVIIVSGDSDFIQVFDTMDSDYISIYHPIKKQFIEKPDYTYLTWKSLCGDNSDNIPGIKGVGSKTALKIINNQEMMNSVMQNDQKRLIFERNKSLIEFFWFDDITNAGIEVSMPLTSFSDVLSTFKSMGLNSMLTESYWPKFKNAFKTLIHERDTNRLSG
jgi:DNA polymerase I